jgi:hypothetical protein
MSVKSLARKHVAYEDRLAEGEDPFSANKVTRFSLNVPIIGTCKPTTVCADTCYFAKGATTWTPSLRKQHRLMNSIKDDPVAVGKRIVASATRKRLSFLRWNGGGDLFEEMLACIDYVSGEMPAVPQWVVSRLPRLAARITPRPNVFLHLSIDKSSWQRLDEFRSLAPAALQWFFSYQCDKDEVPPPVIAPIVFRDGYDPKGSPLSGYDCALNASEKIDDVCESCRACFDGEAVRRMARWA